ncbi:hypothetical protein Y032_0223g2674 [Ancylostoma ceylanicum]|uniref:Uncharacterized protein n=1 Tax=Ancylostoma ceylanicum TaxID=53326 RepID=A0A016SID0_9BILA|nr:hypothetical protein Y032_0223g2674 [Ancylostoma ceylanicum]
MEYDPAPPFSRQKYDPLPFFSHTNCYLGSTVHGTCHPKKTARFNFFRTACKQKTFRLALLPPSPPPT